MIWYFRYVGLNKILLVLLILFLVFNIDTRKLDFSMAGLAFFFLDCAGQALQSSGRLMGEGGRAKLETGGARDIKRKRTWRERSRAAQREPVGMYF